MINSIEKFPGNIKSSYNKVNAKILKKNAEYQTNAQT